MRWRWFTCAWIKGGFHEEQPFCCSSCPGYALCLVSYRRLEKPVAVCVDRSHLGWTIILVLFALSLLLAAQVMLPNLFQK
jgi:hypothetical protein